MVSRSGAYVLFFLGLIWHFIDQFFPQKCAIIGKTKASFNFKKDANILMSESSDFDSFKPGTGTVVGFVYDYVTEHKGKGRQAGVYLGNSKFPPNGYLVRMDDTDRLVYVPLENAVLTAGYSYAIKALCVRMGGSARVGDHNPPLIGLENDVVRFATDLSDIERVINEIAFTPAGEARYYVSMTQDEVKAENQRRKHAAEARGRAWSRIFGNATHGRYTRDQIVFVRKGDENQSGGLSFPELDFSD